MTDREILQALAAGYTLRNRGTGWWLVKPRKAYEPQDMVEILPSQIASLEGAGYINTTLGMWHIAATLSDLGREASL